MSNSGKTQKSARAQPCPCGGSSLSACCGRFLDGSETPRTALELMRSRYAAYALQDEAYLKQTWFESTRPSGRLVEDKDAIKWLSLEVLHHHEDAHDGTVEFVARFKVQGRAQKLHEISRFVHEDGHWFYLDGSFPEAHKK